MTFFKHMTRYKALGILLTVFVTMIVIQMIRIQTSGSCQKSRPVGRELRLRIAYHPI